MYAVIETGGKQYIVRENDVVNVEKLGVEPSEEVTFDSVLMSATRRAMSRSALRRWMGPRSWLRRS